MDINIGGSRGACPAQAPPPWDPILSFSHTFSPKSAHVRGPRPTLTGARPPPLREILDPPLIKVTSETNSILKCTSGQYVSTVTTGDGYFDCSDRADELNCLQMLLKLVK